MNRWWPSWWTATTVSGGDLTGPRPPLVQRPRLEQSRDNGRRGPTRSTISTSTPSRHRPRHRGPTDPDRRGPSTVGPVQFLEPAHTHAGAEQPPRPRADHSETTMRRLRSPFDPDPVRDW
ncbi:hypothetical protein CEP50_09055 [Actinopolyspora mortivallis]|uniref:Uncharacterized protein n=1 Tax=Actinopolyspora mortivallis TaxID=33906 RepID=A0A2T0GXA8_ACTMO|nr:hypothetical protein CEP50_09055 [Actinopolyspora mortivallis]